MILTRSANDQTVTASARRGAAVIAVVTAVTLATRLFLRVQQSETLVAALSFMTQFFTILTNTMTLLLMLWIALDRHISPRIIKAVVISIVCVGLIYHALLAHFVSLSGLDLLSDHGTHTVVPLLALPVVDIPCAKAGVSVG